MTDETPTQLPYDNPDVYLSPGYWLWNNQAPPPSSGQVRTNSRDWAGATQLTVDRRMDGGSDASVDLSQIKVGDTLRLEHQTDATRFAVFKVTAAPQRIVDYYQYGVSYTSGGGTIPNSGTRIQVTMQAAPPSGTQMNWTISAAREPSRWWIRCNCQHGQTAELAAALGLPSPSALVPTTATNVRRRTQCTCADLTPPPPSSLFEQDALADETRGYISPETQGYTEASAE